MENKSSNWTAHLALAAVAVFYAINYFTLKEVFREGVSNFAVLSIRCSVAVIGFVLFHQLVIRAKMPARKDMGRLFLCGIFGVGINQTFFLWGLSQTSRVNAAVLMITTPVFVFALAAIMKQERITARKILGLLLSGAGAVGLILSGSSESIQISGASILGDLMIMTNAASYGIYLVIVQPLIQKYNVFTIVMWIFVFGAIPNFFIGLPDLLKTDLLALSAESIFGIVFLIVGATFGAYFLNAWAMKKLPSSAVGVYIYVQPVLVTLLSAGLGLGEVGWLNIQFILLIFVGVYLVTMQRTHRTQ
ncbi:MAG: DMT family transporter [Bacteroidota bacterium]